ncbi:MAG: RDD family protein [Flavobacteriales bacterium]|nr:RDD family protein [Flavobacteriales bacterium]
METVHIETSQNVSLHYEVATIVDRGLAVVIDWILLAGYTIALVMLMGQFDIRIPQWGSIILFGVPWTFYHLVSELLMDGQSLGKRSRNIKVTRLDGGQPGLGHYLLRWMLRLIDSMFFLGAVVILFNGKGQRLGDLAAGTSVISLKQRFSLADTLLMNVPEGHQVKYPEAERLTDAHARLIKEVLGNTSRARPMALTKLAGRFQDELAITQRPQPEEFLRTLLADYLFLTGK